MEVFFISLFKTKVVMHSQLSILGMYYHCCNFNEDCWRTPLRFFLSHCSRRRWWCISNVLATWLRMTKSKKGFKGSRWTQLICLLLCRELNVQHCFRIIATIGPGSTHLSSFFGKRNDWWNSQNLNHERMSSCLRRKQKWHSAFGLHEKKSTIIRDATEHRFCFHRLLC